MKEFKNFGNLVADISILGQFCIYLQFRGEKYLNSFIVTNANNCPNLLSHGATFRMGVLLPNYPEENVVKGENAPNFKFSTSTGTSSNVFQVLQDLWLKQYQNQEKCYPDSMQIESKMSCTSTTGTLIQNTAQSTTSFRTTKPYTARAGRMTTKQVNPVQVPQETSCKAHLESCMHVQQPMSQVCKPGELLALRKVKPLNGRTSVSRLALTKQDILSQYSGCFEGIGHFPGDLYKFHLKPEHKPAWHAPRKVPIHLETTFKEEIESLVEQGILEEVKEHTDWTNSYVIVEKDTGNHHSPNHTVKKKLRICFDPRDLNEALEREPYHTRSVDEITAKLQGMTVFTIADFKTWSAEEITAKFLSRDRMEHIGHFPISIEMYMDDHLTLTTGKTQWKQFQGKASEQSCSTHSISPHSQKNTVLSHAEFPLSMGSIPLFPGKQFLQGKEKFTLPGNQFLQGKEKSTLGTELKPFVDTCTSTLGTDQQPLADIDQKPSTSSKDTHKKGRMAITIGINMVTTYILMSVHSQDSSSKKLDWLRKSTAQGNQLTRLGHYINTGLPCDKKSLPTDLQELWNDRETLSIKSRMNIIMNTIRIIIKSEHSSDIISNRLAWPGKNTSQKKHITRLEGHNNIDQLCDRENLPTDLPESWPYKEPLHNKSELINYGNICQYIHNEFYILPRPSKAMTQWKFSHMQKEVYILSRPSKLQPVANYSIASLLFLMTQKDLPLLLSTLGAQEMYQYTHKKTLHSFRFRIQTGETNISST